MNAGTLVRCHCCEASRPASEVFVPYAGVVRCRDAAACEQRALRAYDPTLLAAEDLPTPPPAGAPAGAACGICGASGPGLYERIKGQFVCRDRDRCQRDSVERLYLTAWSDTSPDRFIDSATMRQAISAAGPERPVVRTPQYLEAAAEHARTDLGYSIAAAARRR